MSDRVFRYRLIALALIAAYTALVWLGPTIFVDAAVDEAVLTVHFLDVGQGDAILVELPTGAQLLFDGGPNSDVLTQLSQHLPLTDRTVEVVLGTHPDLDHVAGLVDVLGRYRVSTIITTEATGESPAAVAWQEAVPAENATVHQARAGDVFRLGPSTTLQILSPSYDPSRLNSNAGSIVARLLYGNTSFLLTGDAPQGVEQYLAATYGDALHADVLKLGHHGSDTSSQVDFLATVAPRYAVVSAGVDNRYQHPDPAVLQRVADHTDATIVSTQHGTVSFRSDGQSVQLIR